jgi:hypothetical protein
MVPPPVRAVNSCVATPGRAGRPRTEVHHGVIVWAVASKPKVAEFGRMTALAGLIGLVFSLSGHYFPRR